ncbi:hypothetical protein [Microcystis aeruginosa]|nr:hypothetical protein [Microcystis aeruginosa]
MQKTKGGINNQFLITGFSIKFKINAIFSKKSTRLRAGKKGKEKK